MGKAEFNDIGPSVLSPRGASDLPLRERGKGYTLIEVMIAVTLTLVLMYALAAIFGRVTSIMTQTQDILSMTNNLRAAKDRLREDLENLTVPHLKAPTSRYGFFSYMEGQGNAPMYFGYREAPNGYLFATNSRTFKTYGNFDRSNATVDNTVGDTDDILSFTVRAPAGRWFRGRCFGELSEDTASYDLFLKDDDTEEEKIKKVCNWLDDKIVTIESEYAEVVWFLRGTTLYRRVLLIIPDEVLEKRLQALNRAIQYVNSILSTDAPVASAGFGFYRFFDVSVHYDPGKTFDWTTNGAQFSSLNGQIVPNTLPDLDGRVVANTLHDLANRENRFGYWSSPLDTPKSFVEQDSPLSTPIYDYGDYGLSGSWYWMRLPTLQESALWSPSPGSVMPELKYFRAGFPFGRSPVVSDYEQSVGRTLYFWMGDYLRLGLGHIGPNPNNDMSYNNANLYPDVFIDEWQYPNPWVQQQSFSGQIVLSDIIGLSAVKTLNNDVLLTNVLSFDVKVWNEMTSSFVDLGAGEVLSENSDGELIRLDGEPLFDREGNEISPPVPDSTNFLTGGNYSHNVVNNLPLLRDPATRNLADKIICYRPIMPAVYDTWTEEYQKEFLTQSWPITLGGELTKIFGASSRPGFTVGDIPLDGNVTASDLPDYPPPYEAEIKVIQVGLRTFDPVSRTIKNATVEIKIP